MKIAKSKIALLILLVLPLSTGTDAQELSPSDCQEYYRRSMYFSEVYTLCPDGQFYYSSSGENGNYYYSKGSWVIEGDQLIINSYEDSAYTFIPRVEILADAEETDSVEVVIKSDILKDPIATILGLELPLEVSPNYDYISVQNQKMVLSKNEFGAIFLPFEIKGYNLYAADSIGIFFTPEMKRISINTEFYGTLDINESWNKIQFSDLRFRYSVDSFWTDSITTWYKK